MLPLLFFRIGRDNAPFHVISKIQTTKISTNPTHSEYNVFSLATFSILLAPQFPKNSKNLIVQDRNVRAAYRDKILTPVHVLSK